MRAFSRSMLLFSCTLTRSHWERSWVMFSCKQIHRQFKTQNSYPINATQCTRQNYQRDNKPGCFVILPVVCRVGTWTSYLAPFSPLRRTAEWSLRSLLPTWHENCKEIVSKNDSYIARWFGFPTKCSQFQIGENHWSRRTQQSILLFPEIIFFLLQDD